MKNVCPHLSDQKVATPRPRRFPRVWLGAAVLAVAAMQLACTERLVFSPAAAIATFAPTDVPVAFNRKADFGMAQPSSEARLVADRILQAQDHAGSDFLIVDKKDAALYVFGADGTLRGSSAVLLGAAVGDDSVPGIGERPVAQIRPEERTTPAGRFIGERGKNLQGDDIVWVDYDAAVSMHRVRATNPKERRLERLATPGADDNRISYGCINVPVSFFDAFVAPAFADQRAIIYVLPEVNSLTQTFTFYARQTKS